MIVKMTKMTFIGVETDKERFLKRLQEVGIVHLIHPKDPIESQGLAKELAAVTETRKFLASKFLGEKPKGTMSGRMICEKREALSQRETHLAAEIAALKKEMALLQIWGDFRVEDLDDLRRKGLHVQFFRASQKVFETLSLKNVYHRIIGTSRGEICFVTVSLTPVTLNVPEEKLPLKSLSTIRMELESKSKEINEIEAEYVSLADHLETLKKAETTLADLLEYRRAVLNTGEALDGHLFTVKCWSPLSEIDLASKIGTSFSLYHYSEAAMENERVPVMMINKRAFDSGEDLVKIYSYPSYQDSDPSGFVLYFFAVFFGMIVGDAGYGLTLLAATLLLHLKFKSRTPFAVRFFRLMYLLGISVTVYGVLSAGYFGLMISPENPLSKLTLLDFSTKEGQNKVMIFSIIIGMIHISISHLIKFKNSREYAPLGWIIVIWAGYFLANSKMGSGESNPPATYALIIGLIIVFVFSSNKKNVFFRILEGLNGLLGIVQIFSDVLSYLRLFALGIATVYMAQTFNMLAEGIVKSLPWIGYVFAALVLFLGHTVNLLLGVMGGVIHGLRLNFLEWYRWCFVGDGLVYKPFCVANSKQSQFK